LNTRSIVCAWKLLKEAAKGGKILSGLDGFWSELGRLCVTYKVNTGRNGQGVRYANLGEFGGSFINEIWRLVEIR
jgi:hypothetical protein